MFKSRLFQSLFVLVLLLMSMLGGVMYLSSDDVSKPQNSVEGGSEKSKSPEANPIELPSLREMIGQKLMLGFMGDSKDSPGAQILAQQLQKGQVGGVVLLGRNFTTQENLAELTRHFQACGSPLLPWIAVDQEGGLVQRLGKKLGFPQQPAAQTVSESMSPQEAQPSFSRLATDSRDFGFNVNLAPVVDLQLHAENQGIGASKRSYGSQADAVIAYARVFIEAQQQQGLMPVLKHFPGHGSSVVDPHFGIADITDHWSEEELKPFAELSKMTPAPAVMVGHLMHRKLDPNHPASLSHAMVQELLRDKLGFDGVVICDDIRMQAITSKYPIEEALVLAIEAGVDAIMISDEPHPEALIEHVVQAVESGRLKQTAIEDSYRRIHQFKQQSAVATGWKKPSA